MTAPDLVTIGIPCYNAEETIHRAIRSALVQDWPRIEIIVVDDASSDRSMEVATAAARGDPRVRVIGHEVNSGPAATRNTILAESSGSFVAFFDDDDESAPERVPTQLRRIVEYEERCKTSLVACYASGTRIYPNGYILDLPAIGSRGTDMPNGPGIANYLLAYQRRPNWFYGAGTPTCALMARRSTLVAVGGFDSRFRRVEDADFAIRLGLQGGHCIGTTEYLFRQYATQASDKSAEKNRDAELLLVEKNRSYLEASGLYYHAYHWPRLRYWHFRRRYARFLLCALGLFIRNPVLTMAHLFATGPKRVLHEQKITG